MSKNQSMESVATTAWCIHELSSICESKTVYHFNGIEQPLYSGPLLVNSTNDKVILKGKRDKASTLWMIPIIQTLQKSYNY